MRTKLATVREIPWGIPSNIPDSTRSDLLVCMLHIAIIPYEPLTNQGTTLTHSMHGHSNKKGEQEYLQMNIP